MSLFGRVLCSVWVKFLLGVKTFFISYRWHAQNLGQDDPHTQQKRRLSLTVGRQLPAQGCSDALSPGELPRVLPFLWPLVPGETAT